MKLSELVLTRGLRPRGVLPDVEVSGLASDVRDVHPGDLVVAVPEFVRDAATFARDAVARGAVAIVSESENIDDCGVPVLVAQDTRRVLAFLADRFHGSPSRALSVIGITGTNGKSATQTLTCAALDGAGMNSTALSPQHEATGRGARPRWSMLPALGHVHAMLRQAVDEGRQSCVIELSSHALAGGQIDGVRLACGVFVGMARDHLDHHGTMSEYIDAKAELFRSLPRGAVAVLNRDDPVHEAMAAATRATVVTFGLENGGDIHGSVRRLDSSGAEMLVRAPFGELLIRTPLVGRHTLSNLLGAFAAAVAVGADPSAAARGLAGVDVLPGCLERVPVAAPISVWLNRAANDAALEQALHAVRACGAGRVLVVVGCGGDRWRGRRARIARVAGRLADWVMMTTDNPRSEHPSAIIADMIAGVDDVSHVDIDVDRARAIRRALAEARAGDSVVIVRESNDPGQFIGDHVLPFDDRAVAQGVFPWGETA